jgi:hypothetical protein
MKLYTGVIHYLQMCMKEYGCCPKFGRGDNLTYVYMRITTFSNFFTRGYMLLMLLIQN